MMVDATMGMARNLNRHIKHAGVPLWRQLKNILEDEIHQGQWQPHAKLPSEHQLCDRYRISRTVVREALGELTKEQLIYRIQGKGAFVSVHKQASSFAATNVGFFTEMQNKGKRVITHVVNQEIATPSARIAEFLELQPNQSVVNLHRQMSILHVPYLLTRMAFPAHLVPGLEKLDVNNRSMYETLETQYQLKPVRSERWMEAVLPSPEEAELLGVRITSPLIAIESCAYTAAGTPIEYYYTLYRSDVSRLHFENTD